MKRIFAVVLILSLLLSCASAEDIDLSGLSFEQLVILQQRVTEALMQCNEWQEVKVPVGIWKVGEDIPAGKWTIKCATNKYSYITIGTLLRENGLSISLLGDHYASGMVVSTNYAHYKPDVDATEIYFTLIEGDYIHIQDSAVIFTPYIGKPNLGFK